MQTLATPTPLTSGVQLIGTRATAARQSVVRGAWLCNAALFMAGAAAIHLSGAPQQLPRSMIIAASLALLALAQFVAAAAVVTMPNRMVIRAAAIFNATSAAIWLVAHSFGLPAARASGDPKA